MKIKFKREYLSILSSFAAKNDLRSYLNGFHIKPHPNERGVILTATDGHRLVTIYDEYGLADDQYILPITKELLTASKKTRTKDKRPLTEIQIINDKAYILCAENDVIDWFNEEEPEEIDRVYHVEYISNISGTYPNIKRIFESIEYKETSTICIKPKYIGELVKICANSMMNELNLMFCGVDGSIVAIGGKNKEIVALVMPCKGESKPIKLPDFVCLSGGVGVSKVSENEEEQGELNIDEDVIYDEVVKFVKKTKKISISTIQRKFGIGRNRAAHIVEQLEQNNVFSTANA